MWGEARSGLGGRWRAHPADGAGCCSRRWKGSRRALGYKWRWNGAARAGASGLDHWINARPLWWSLLGDYWLVGQSRYRDANSQAFITLQCQACLRSKNQTQTLACIWKAIWKVGCMHGHSIQCNLWSRGKSWMSICLSRFQWWLWQNILSVAIGLWLLVL